MKLFQRLLDGSVSKLTRAACVFALLGLSLMSYSIVDPRAIPVITAMSLGHAFGIAAFACYLLAIVLDLRGRGSADAAPSLAPKRALRHSDSTGESEAGRDP